MNKDSLEYYIICQNWSLDSNQWQILIGTIAVLLTTVGFIVAFILYYKQRNHSSKDAYIFFQSSLPELKSAIESTIKNLEKFIKDIESDKVSIPVLSASLNDKFISRINLTDLHRYYSKKRIEKLEFYNSFMVDSSYLGIYHSYFTNEINNYRSRYIEEENIFSKWQLLRSNQFYSSFYDQNENLEYKEIYHKWVNDLKNDLISINDKKSISKIIQLAVDVAKFIPSSEKANEVNLMANKIISAYNNITKMNDVVLKVLKRDIEKFEDILINLDRLID